MRWIVGLRARGVEFDAIFAAADVAAIGAMHALQQAGRSVPDEVAVVGFDDIARRQPVEPATDYRYAGRARRRAKHWSKR